MVLKLSDGDVVLLKELYRKDPDLGDKFLEEKTKVEISRNKNRKEKKKLKRLYLAEKNKSIFTLEMRAEKFRKDLVKHQTPSEKTFKALLKSLKIEYDFQHIIYGGNSFYIADFYLPQYKVVIEIDGGYHDTKVQQEKDKIRTFSLRENGVKKVIRFKNNDLVDTNRCREKLKDIIDKLEKKCT